MTQGRTVYEVQRDFGMSSGLRTEIIWDSISEDQIDVLKLKIDAFSYYVERRGQRIEKKPAAIWLQNIWNQRKYTNNVLLHAIIYVLVVDENVISPLDARKFSIHPVFRTRKCLDNNKSAGCCMIFIDEMGRVYQNWQQYVKNNVLPKGKMVAPKNGVYMFNSFEAIILETNLTPAASVKTTALKKTDIATGITGLAATVPIAASLVVPVAAPVMAVAYTVGLVTAGYCTVRSGMDLSNRHKHEQSINLKDREARNNWIGVAGGVVGMGSTGATQILKAVANTGNEISIASKIAVNGMNISSAVLSGTGVANGVYDIILKIKDDENISTLNVMQLAASLVVFTNSINNVMIASKIKSGSSSSSTRSRLISQLRSLYEDLNTSSNGDIIRSANDIPSNNVLGNLVGLATGIPNSDNGLSSNLPTSVHQIISASDPRTLNQVILKIALGVKFVQRIRNFSNFHEILSSSEMQQMCVRTQHWLLNQTRIFMDDFVDDIERMLNTIITSEIVLNKMMHYIIYYRHLSYEYIVEKSDELIAYILTYFNSLNPNNLNLKRQKCQQCKGYFVLSKI